MDINTNMVNHMIIGEVVEQEYRRPTLKKGQIDKSANVLDQLYEKLGEDGEENECTIFECG